MTGSPATHTMVCQARLGGLTDHGNLRSGASRDSNNSAAVTKSLA